MTRVSPPLDARALPAPQASTSVTRRPARSSASALHPPNAPAPTTTTWSFRRRAPLMPNRATSGAATTDPTKVRREIASGSVMEAQREAERPRLVGEVADARTQPTLAIQREQRPLVGDVVDEGREIPVRARHADAEVHEVVRRELGIELEHRRRQRPADRVRAEGVEVHPPDPLHVVVDLRDARADVGEAPRHEPLRAVPQRPAEGRR